MSNKRFEKSKSNVTNYRIYDYEKEDAYFIDCDDEHTVDAIVNLLNEQQNMIKDLTSQLEIFYDDFERVVSENSVLRKENEKLKKWLLLYDEDEVDKYLRTHPMPTTTITTKRKVIPLNMRHKW